jgi:hypothetical protein
MGVLVNAIPTIIPVMTFLAYLLIRREPLSAAQAFTALSLFNVLRFPLFQLPQIVTQVRLLQAVAWRPCLRHMCVHQWVRCISLWLCKCVQNT